MAPTITVVQRPEQALRDCWHRLTGGSASDEGALEVRCGIIEHLLARYREPARHYHTATHVMWVLRHVEHLLARTADDVDDDAVRAAALFHDYVYDPTSSTNEHDSADVAVLGSDAAAYDRYVRGIRAEYAHVSEDAWRIGRARVLETFLARERIYRTPAMAAAREAAARANITAELDRLRR
jgi:predicted metal-dependent HD superfamily phosphohydrolase